MGVRSYSMQRQGATRRTPADGRQRHIRWPRPKFSFMLPVCPNLCLLSPASAVCPSTDDVALPISSRIGWTTFENLYQLNGTLYVVSSRPDKLPSLRKMISSGAPVGNSDEERAATSVADRHRRQFRSKSTNKWYHLSLDSAATQRAKRERHAGHHAGQGGHPFLERRRSTTSSSDRTLVDRQCESALPSPFPRSAGHPDALTLPVGRDRSAGSGPVPQSLVSRYSSYFTTVAQRTDAPALLAVPAATTGPRSSSMVSGARRSPSSSRVASAPTARSSRRAG